MKEKLPWDDLQQYLPEGSLSYVLPLILEHKVHLTITRPRNSKLGDYRLPRMHENHKISVNGNLNKYEFLITLLHELAHMLTFVTYGRNVLPHGREWQNMYSKLLAPTLLHNYFPQDIAEELKKTIQQPAASCAGEIGLIRVLKKHNLNQSHANLIHVEDVPPGQLFKIENGSTFKIEKKMRTRYLCAQVPSNKKYSFPALYNVELILD
jgi:SprT protein